MSGDRRAALLATITAAQQELSRLETVPDPADLPGGTVILWTQSYPDRPLRRDLYVPPGRVDAYTFVAYKAPTGYWYTTARREDCVLTDAQLRVRLASDRVGEISIVSAWDQLQ